jgi:outer membrane protein
MKISVYPTRESQNRLLLLIWRITVTAVMIGLLPSYAQAQDRDMVLPDILSLEGCIRYAFDNQPSVKQVKLDEYITRQDIRIALSDWLPQITSEATLGHYIKQPVIIFPDLTNPSGPKRQITTGVVNNSGLQLTANQLIFDNEVYIAGKTVKYYRLQSRQNTEVTLIGLVVSVSKAFYDALLSQQQLNIINEDIARLTKSLADAYAQYQSGTVDKIDYKQATISLNNAKAQKVAAEQAIKAKYAYLKELMGYPVERKLVLNYDSLSLAKDMILDTLQEPRYDNRIEYQLLKTNLQLQKSNIDYYKLSFLPSLSGYANYNLVYQNDNFNELYNMNFPNSSIGLTLTFPIFEGTQRMQNLKKARLQYNRLTLDTLNLESQINTEYIQAMSAYKSNMVDYEMTLQNIAIAREVYDLVKYQYEQGVTPYLEVIVSQTDLRTAEINNLNALLQVLSSKLDVEQALGNISINY